MARFAALLIFLFLLYVDTNAQDSVDLGIVESFVDNPSPFVGEPISYTFRYFDPGGLVDVRYIPADFSGFGQLAQPVGSSIEVRDGVQYLVLSQETLLFPLQAGTLTIRPASIRIPEGPFQSGGILETVPIIISVKDFPADAPPSFKGAVGQFTFQVDADRTSLIQGEALSLSATISGTGNFEQLLAPEIFIPEGLQSYANPPVSTLSDTSPTLGSKSFRWTLIPEQAGSFTIPQALFSYLDPQTGTYQTLPGAVITIEVSPGTASPAPTVIPTPTAEARPPLTLRQISETGSLSEPALSMAFWILWIFPPLLLIGAGYYSHRQRRAEKDLAKTRQAQALKIAMQALKRARSEHADSAMHHVRQIILAYFANRSGQAEEKFEAQIARQRPYLQQKLTQILEQIELSRYAPTGKDDAQQIIQETAAALQQLDREWAE